MIEINDQCYDHIYKFHLISIEEIGVLWMGVPGYFLLLKEKPQIPIGFWGCIQTN